MTNPIKKVSIGEKLKRNLNNSNIDTMRNKKSVISKKSDSNKNNSSKVTVDSESAKEKKYLIINADNNHEIKCYQDFDPKMQAIFKLFEIKDYSYHKLVKYTDNRLYALKNSGRYSIDSEDLVYEIIEKLIKGILKWDQNIYSDPFYQVKYHIYWKTKKLYELYEKMDGEKEFADFTSQDLFKDDLYQMDDADYDIIGNYQNLNEEELKKHNQTLHVNDWYDKKANPFQKKVIDLKRDGLKDQEIASKLKQPVKNVYNVIKNNKGKFKDLQF